MDTMTTPQWKHWFDGKELTTNWLGNSLIHWFEPLAPWRERPCSVLEIGSYEGRSAIAFLECLPHCHLTAVDIFSRPQIESRFDRNMRSYEGRVTKIKERGSLAMDKMLLNGEQFDVIYLDTGKNRAVAFAQSALAWPLLRTGGILIWDDLAWKPERPADDRPGPGIRLFTDVFSDCLTILHEGNQLIARKTGEWTGSGGH